MTNRSIIGLLLICLLVGPTFAVKVDLYQVELPVASQSADARTEAALLGFEQILVRLTGDINVVKNPIIKENLNKAGYFIQEYHYALPSANSSEYQIFISFDAEDINRLLKRAGVSYWGPKRPLILAFLAVKAPNGQLEVIGDDSSNDIASALKLYSNKYGLPLILPAMDMEDLNQFTPEDISGVLLPVLKNAGKRYAPDVYLIGNIQQNFGGYESQWQLISNTVNKQWNWTVTDRTIEKIIANVMDQVSQNLSNRHAIKKVDPADIWVKLEVSNILERDELTQLVQYLKQLTIVRDVQLSQVSGNSVKIAVLVRGSLDTFQQNAALGQHLILKGAYSDANILLYEWVH